MSIGKEKKRLRTESWVLQYVKVWKRKIIQQRRLSGMGNFMGDIFKVIDFGNVNIGGLW